MTVKHRCFIAASFCAVVMVAALSVTLAQEAEATEADKAAFHADIIKLLKLTGAEAVGKQAFDATINSMKASAPPDVPEGFWETLREEFDVNDFLELMAPVYAKHLTHDDVKALAAFYESTAWKNLMAAQPNIMADSQAVGRQWGQELAKRVLAKLEEYQQQQQE